MIVNCARGLVVAAHEERPKQVHCCVAVAHYQSHEQKRPRVMNASLKGHEQKHQGLWAHASGSERTLHCSLMPGADMQHSLSAHTRSSTSGKTARLPCPESPARHRRQLTACSSTRVHQGRAVGPCCALKTNPRLTKLCKTVHGSCARPPRPPFVTIRLTIHHIHCTTAGMRGPL
jgi:hypothetical protein